MKCPFCSFIESKVIDTRPTDNAAAIRRRRECLSCQKRFTTYEMVERLPLLVIKKDGSRQDFDRIKILNGLIRASQKRNIPISLLESITANIEHELLASLDPEVQSSAIGELTLAALKDLDDIAYIRFASVYRSFSSISDFMDELTSLLHDKNSGSLS